MSPAVVVKEILDVYDELYKASKPGIAPPPMHPRHATVAWDPRADDPDGPIKPQRRTPKQTYADHELPSYMLRTDLERLAVAAAQGAPPGGMHPGELLGETPKPKKRK